MNRRRCLALIGAGALVGVGGAVYLSQPTKMEKIPRSPHEFRAVFHIHTNLSGDNYLRDCTLERYIEKAFEEELDLLTITDKSEDLALDYLLALPSDFSYKIQALGGNVVVVEKGGKQLYFLRGIEYHSHSKNLGGHLLALGHTKRIMNEARYTAHDLIKIIHDNSGLAVPAHPFAIEAMGTKLGGMGLKLMEIKDEVDAVEVFNAQNICLIPGIIDARQFNYEAKAFADRHHLARICGVDCHRVEDLGVCFMKFPRERVNLDNGDKLVNSLKKLIAETRNREVYRQYAFERYNPWAGFVDYQVRARVT